jgi:hypothetical protein
VAARRRAPPPGDAATVPPTRAAVGSRSAMVALATAAGHRRYRLRSLSLDENLRAVDRLTRSDYRRRRGTAATVSRRTRAFAPSFATGAKYDGAFNFCRIMFCGSPHGDGGNWSVDYPRAIQLDVPVVDHYHREPRWSGRLQSLFCASRPADGQVSVR